MPTTTSSSQTTFFAAVDAHHASLRRTSAARLAQLSPFKPLAIAIALLASASHARGESTLESFVIAADLDWQPIAQTPEAERDLQCRQCGGQFVDPFADLAKTNPLDEEVQISAQDSDINGATMTFSGEVSVQQGSRLMRADQVVIDRTSQSGDATGNVTLREPGVVLKGDSARYDGDTQIATVNNARFALHRQHISGVAATLERQVNGDIEIRNGAVTYCAPDDPTWLLRSESVAIAPDEGNATARDVTVEISGVPVLYLPWIRFPTDTRRETGLLFPDVGSDTRGGLDVTAPIYFNLAPNYDATYSLRTIAERGVGHELNGRYLGADIGYWEIDANYLSDDQKYASDFNNNSNDRWLLGAQHNGKFGDNWRTTVDFTRVSDVDYVRDLENQSLSAQRQTALLQLGQVDYLGEDWLVSVQAQQFQNLANDIRNNYKKLPQITARYRGAQTLYGFEPIAHAQYSNFDTDDGLVTGQRSYAELGVSYPMRWISGYVRPTVKYRQLNYELDYGNVITSSANSDENPSAGSAVASLDAGLILERQFSFGEKSFTQTLEPRAFYLYSEYSEQGGNPDFDTAELTFGYNQLYRDTRFSGNDRLDDANQVSLGVTTRFFDNEDGQERLTASIGQIYYLKDRRVRLNTIDPALVEQTSAIAVEASWRPDDRWDVRASFLYDTNENTFDAASAQVGYFPGDGSVFNVGYILREPPPSLVDRPVTEQAKISGYYPLDDNWRLFGAFEYSLEASSAVEDMVGFEYDDCCVQFRVLYMRYIDTARGDIPDFTDPNLERENALQFQFVLKGMGGFGGRVDDLLGDMIRGFNRR